MIWCDCEGRRVPRGECNHCGADDWEDIVDGSYEDPPLYADGQLAAMDEAALQREWERQCNIHDHGVDNLPMNHPTIENAAARMNWIESEQKRRKLKAGPSDAWLEDG